MEYRRLGKMNLTVSAVCMGGHTGETDEREDFDENRHNVISCCIKRLLSRPYKKVKGMKLPFVLFFRL